MATKAPAKTAPVKKAAPTKAAPEKKAPAKTAPKAAPKAEVAKVPAKIRMKELAAAVQAKIGIIGLGTVEKVITETFAVMIENYAAGNVVDIKDFGKLAVVHRPARTGRNPATGAPVEIPAKTVPKFTFAKAMKEMAQ